MNSRLTLTAAVAPLAAAFALMSANCVAYARDTYYPADATINSTLSGYVYAGYANAADLASQTNGTSPTIGIVNGGFVNDTLYSYNSSAINVSGGSVNLLEAFNSSAINLSSGSVLRIDSYNNSTINISGGILSSGLYGYNDTTVSVSGGIIGSLTLTDNGVLNFFGTGFSSSYQGDHSGQFVYDVTGTLASGDKLNTVIFLDDTSQARFTFNAPAVVPESSSMALFGGIVTVGVGILRRKRRK